MVMICYLPKKEDYRKPVDIKKKYVKADRENLETESTEENETFAKMKNKNS